MLENEHDHSNSQSNIESKSGHDNIIYTILVVIVLYFIFSALLHSNADLTGFKTLNTIFISILLQAFPFMLVGIIISSVIHIYVPDKYLVKVFPVKYGLGFITAMFLGLLFPVCECAIVPVMKQLVKKGVPVPIALTFMLAAPIINPIAIISTVYAFPGHPEIAVIRVGLGLFTALIIGLMFLLLGSKNDILTEQEHHHAHECCHCHTHEHEHDCCGHEHGEEHSENKLFHKIKEVFLHTGEEFFGVGKYLIIGAFIAALTQRLIPQSVFTSISSHNILPLIVMMLTAFCFSACSTSDAFIARSFLNSFPLSAIMGFMVFGPMMDIKNMMMLIGIFKKSFVAKLCAVIFIVNFLVMLLAAYFIK